MLGRFDQIFSDNFPYPVPPIYVVVRLTAGPAEFGMKKDVQLVLLDPDGKPIGKIGAKGMVPSPDSGGRANLELILRMVGVPLEKPGRYAISVLVGGEEKQSIPLEAVMQKASRRPGRAKRDG